MKEHHMTRRVARAMADTERDVTETNFITVGEPAIGRAVLGVGKARTPGVPAKGLKQKGVVRVRTFYRNVHFSREPRCTTRVIQMAMGEEHFFEVHTGGVYCRFEAIDLAAG